MELSSYFNNELLLESSNNPDLFNLHLKDPKDILLDLIEQDDIKLFMRIHKSFAYIYKKEYDTNYWLISDELLGYIVKSICYSKEICPIHILSYLLINYFDKFDNKKYTRLINSFNAYENDLNDSIKLIIKVYTNSESLFPNIIVNYDSDLYKISDWKVKYENIFQQIEDEILDEHIVFINCDDIENELSKKYYADWLNKLFSYWLVLHEYYIDDED